MQAIGLVGISKSQVYELCKDIDERVHAFLARPLAGEWPSLWLDATYLKQREGGRIVSVAAIIAVAVNTDGKREIVRLHIGPSEAETFWSSWFKSLARRGLQGVKLGILGRARGAEGGDRRGFGPLLAAFAVSHGAERTVLRGEDPAEHGGRSPTPGVPSSRNIHRPSQTLRHVARWAPRQK